MSGDSQESGSTRGSCMCAGSLKVRCSKGFGQHFFWFLGFRIWLIGSCSPDAKRISINAEANWGCRAAATLGSERALQAVTFSGRTVPCHPCPPQASWVLRNEVRGDKLVRTTLHKPTSFQHAQKPGSLASLKRRLLGCLKGLRGLSAPHRHCLYRTPKRGARRMFCRPTLSSTHPPWI